MTEAGTPRLTGSALTDAISAAMVELYAEFYGHARTTATTYVNDNVLVCVLEDILSDSESSQIAEGASVTSSTAASPSSRALKMSSPPPSSA